MVIMLIGVISFSFVNGTLASIVSSMDSSNAEQKEVMERFNRINKNFNIPTKLQLKMRKNMSFQVKNQFKEAQVYL